MKNFIIKITKKLLNIPAPYIVAFGIMTVLLGVTYGQGALDLNTVIIILAVGLIIGLQIYMGSVVIKSVMAIVFSLYMTSYYTITVMNQHYFITQPFLLTLAVLSAFIAQTYSSSNYTLGIRSRALWTTVLGSILIPLKVALIVDGYSFLITEVIGLNIAVLYTVIWRYWVKSSKKTKIVEPSILKISEDELYKRIYINNTLDIKSLTWTRGSFYKSENAFPYIYNEVMKAYEDNKILVIVSKIATSRIYDLGEIVINKSRVLPYLYMEAKEDKYVDSIYDDFIVEITESDKYLLITPEIGE